MANKRKLLLLLGVSSAMVVGTLFAVSTINGDIFGSFDRSQTNGEFSMEFKSNENVPLLGEDGWYHYRVGLSDGVHNVGVKVKGVEISTDEKNPGVFLNSEKYAFITNEADEPIRGISRLDFSVSLTGYSSQHFLSAIYYSYNPINMSDVLAGKYQDLKTYIGVNYCYGNQSYWDPGSTAARYFLVVLANPGDPIKLDNMTVTTPCDKEPTEVPVGTYPDSFNIEDIPSAVPTLGNGSFALDMNAPETGTEVSVGITALQAAGGRDDYYNKLTTNGYSKTGELSMYTAYQKHSHDDLYYTVLDFGESYNFDGYTNFNFVYIGEFKAFVQSSSWPKSSLDSVFSSESFKDLLVDPEMPEGLYVFSSEEGLGYVSLSYPENIELETYQAALTKMRAYGDYFISEGYEDYNSSSAPDSPSDPYRINLRYSKTLISPDLTHTVDLYFYYNKVLDSSTLEVTGEEFYCSFSFYEAEATAFPSAELAAIFGANMIPDMNAPGATFVKQRSTIYNPAIEHQLVYFSKTLTSEDVATYFASLGEEWSAIYEGAYIKLYGDYVIPHVIQIYISKGAGDWIELNFISGTYANSTNSFTSAVNSATSYSSYEAANQLAQVTGFNSKSATYYTSISTGEGYSTIYCEGFGEEELNTLMACCVSDPSLGADNHFFVYSSAIWLVKASVVSDSANQYLAITIENVDINFLMAFMMRTDNVAFNSAVDTQLRNYQSDFTDDELATFHFNTEGTYYYLSNNKVMVITDSSETTSTIRNAFISRLESDSHIEYSEYKQAYFQVDRDIAINYSEVSSQMGLYYFTIEFAFNEQYEDYLTYGELLPLISEFTNLDQFPSLEKEGRHYIYESCYSASISIYVDNDFAIEYEDAIADAGFEYDSKNNRYFKINSDGDVTMVSFAKEETYTGLTLYYEESYYCTISEVASQTEYLLPFVLPSDEGKIFHLNYAAYNYVEVSYASLNREAYISKMIAADFTQDSSEKNRYYKYVDQDRLLIILDTDRIVFRKFHYSELYDFTSFTVYAVNRGFDDARLDRLPEINSDKLYPGSTYPSNLIISIVDQDFDISTLYDTILAMDCGYVEEEMSSTYAYFVSADNKTNIEVRFDEGIYHVYYRDNRRFFVDIDTVMQAVKDVGMTSYRLSYFVRPNQEGLLYEIESVDAERFVLLVNSETFDFADYANQLIEAGFTESYRNEFYHPSNKGIRISLHYPEEIEFECYISSLYTFDEALERVGANPEISEETLANFIGPDEDYYFESPSYSSYSKNIELYLGNGVSLDFGTYGEKLTENGYELVEFEEEYSAVYRKYGYVITLYEHQIFFRYPYSYDEAIAKVVDYGFDSKELDKFVVPSQTNLQIESAYTSERHLFILTCCNLDVDAYELQLVNEGYVLDSENYSENTHRYYKGHDQIMISLNSETSISIGFSSTYSYSDILNDIYLSDDIKYAFSGPNQEVEYNNQYYADDRGFSVCYYDDTFVLDDYISQLEDEGYVINAGKSDLSEGVYVYEKENLVVKIEIPNQMISYKMKWSYAEVVERAIEYGFDEYQLVNFADPEQDVYYDGAGFNYNSFTFEYGDSFSEISYVAKLNSDERYTCVDDGSSSGVIRFLNGSSLIEINTEMKSITFTSLYTSEDAVALLEDQLIPGTLDGFVFPSDAVYAEVYTSTQTRFFLRYFEQSFDVDSYIALLEGSDYSLDVESTNYYKFSKGDSIIEINTSSCYIAYYDDMNSSELMDYLSTIFSNYPTQLEDFIPLENVSYTSVSYSNPDRIDFFAYFEYSSEVDCEAYAAMLIEAGYEVEYHDSITWYFRKGDIYITLRVNSGEIYYTNQGKY